MDTNEQSAGPVTRGERLGAVIGLISAAVIGLICLDLMTGGALSARFSRTSEGDNPDDCGC